MPAVTHRANAAHERLNMDKVIDLILLTIPVLLSGFWLSVSGGFGHYKLLSLDIGVELLIKMSLLDRFLACMKPASMT